MPSFKLKSFSLILSVLVLGGFYSYGLWAWTGPTSAPPGSNAPTPVNIGTSDQEKAGRLSATEFYDTDDSSFYVNPSGDSKVSGTLSLGGDLYDITNSKKVYDSATGKFDPSVMPFEKGDLTSDWSSNAVTSSYYDVSSLSAGNIKSGISYGRGSSGSLAPGGSATVGDVRSGKTFYSGSSWTQKGGTASLCEGTVTYSWFYVYTKTDVHSLGSTVVTCGATDVGLMAMDPLFQQGGAPFAYTGTKELRTGWTGGDTADRGVYRCEKRCTL